MNKLKFTNHINKTLNHSIQYFDTLSVVNILIDELQRDLLDGEEIRVPNLGKLKLVPLKPKQVKNVVNGEMMETKPSSTLRFSLSKKLVKYLSK